MDTKFLYLNLLKRTLSDYLNIDNPYANGIPPEYWWEKSKIKNLRNKWLVKLLRRSKMLVLKENEYDVEERKHRRSIGVDWPLMQAQTMVGLTRLDNLEFILKDIIKNEIDGDIVETGVWRGGAGIFIRAVLKVNNVTDKLIWLCDSFEGLPSPEPEKYPADAGDKHYTYSFLAVDQSTVKKNFAKFDLLDDQVRFVEGYFENTLEHIPADKFCLLRLDGDMYSSTIVSLEKLYPRLSPGGYVIIDDYGLAPCAEAVMDYRRKNNIREEIIDVDGSGAYWRKE